MDTQAFFYATAGLVKADVTAIVVNNETGATVALPGTWDLEEISPNIYRVTDFYADGSVTPTTDVTLFLTETSTGEAIVAYNYEFSGWVDADVASLQEVIVTTQTPGTVPIPDVWVTVKTIGGTVVSPNVITDGNGNRTFYLPQGTYRFYPYKSLVAWTAAYVEVQVLASPTNVTITGSQYVITPPATNKITLYGFLYYEDGNPVSNSEVKVRISRYPQIAATALIDRYDLTTNTDANGFFSMTLLAGLSVEIVSHRSGFTRIVTLPSTGGTIVDITTL